MNQINPFIFPSNESKGIAASNCFLVCTRGSREWQPWARCWNPVGIHGNGSVTTYLPATQNPLDSLAKCDNMTRWKDTMQKHPKATEAIPDFFAGQRPSTQTPANGEAQRHNAKAQRRRGAMKEGVAIGANIEHPTSNAEHRICEVRGISTEGNEEKMEPRWSGAIFSEMTN